MAEKVLGTIDSDKKKLTLEHIMVSLINSSCNGLLIRMRHSEKQGECCGSLYCLLPLIMMSDIQSVT